jgi:predicted metal-dependent hydrolase
VSLHASPVSANGSLAERRLTFEYAKDMDPKWNPRLPEFACAANSVSLIMPFAEPYFVKSVRAALPQLDDDLRDRAEEYLRQELQHHRQHRRFNDILGNRHARVLRLERWMRRTYGWLGERKGLRFNLAFAAGSETIAFTLARWTEDHLTELFTGADPVPATMFLWHLAEEVEHKTVAFDVYRAVDGSKLRYAAAMVLSLLILTWFTTVGTLMMLTTDRRAWNPLRYLRLLRWALSYVFTQFQTLLVSALPGHHPSDFRDPDWLAAWLRHFDPETGTLPVPTVLAD